MLIGVLIPLVTLMLYMSGYGLVYIDLTPFPLFYECLCYCRTSDFTSKQRIYEARGRILSFHVISVRYNYIYVISDITESEKANRAGFPCKAAAVCIRHNWRLFFLNIFQ